MVVEKVNVVCKLADTGNLCVPNLQDTSRSGRCHVNVWVRVDVGMGAGGGGWVWMKAQVGVVGGGGGVVRVYVVVREQVGDTVCPFDWGSSFEFTLDSSMKMIQQSWRRNCGV
jgi:hypothetical protein